MNASSRAAASKRAALFLGVVLVILFVVRVQVGAAREFTLALGTALRAMGGALGVSEPIAGAAQIAAEGRMVDGLTAVLVGAALALSGALLQGLFRNDLASPGLIGVTSGASLGAMLGILIVGGAAWRPGDEQDAMLQAAAEHAPLVVTGCAFCGALATAVVVMLASTRGGRVSVPTLLLVGVAANACLGGVLAAVQDVLLRVDWQLSQATFGWLFGSLSDRTIEQVVVIAVGAGIALAATPFVATELDLFGGGEETASSLGVSVGVTKAVVLAAAALSAAAAVAVAGQIAFVGLVVPHVVRLLVGSRHAAVLPLSALGGAVFLLGAEAANLALLGGNALRPGIVLSLVGGPFFFALLLRRRNEVATW